jgi:hypothetical protein
LRHLATQQLQGRSPILNRRRLMMDVDADLTFV